AQGVLVLVAVEPPPDRASLRGLARPIRVDQRTGDALQERVDVRARGLRLLVRRHLAVADAVMDLDPRGEVLGILGIELEGVEVEPALGSVLVMALETVLLEKRAILKAGRQKEGDDHGRGYPSAENSRSD